MKKCLGLGLMLLLLLCPAGLVQAGNVGSESELRAGLGDNPVLTSDIVITQPVVIESGNVVIDLKGHTLTLGNTVEDMFRIQGAGTSVTIKNGTMDGAEKGRLLKILGSKVNLEQVTVKNGSTDNYQKNLDGGGVNRQTYQGGAIYLERQGNLSLTDVTFRENHAKKDTPAKEHTEDPDLIAHGGAIYCGGRSTISITGGGFYDNYSGAPVGKRGGAGEGGAIKIEGGSFLYVNSKGGASRTVFDGNHNYFTEGGSGGCQGGAIEVTQSIVKIYNADFVVKGGFDTGGAIKFEGAGQKVDQNIVEDSSFQLVGGQLPTKPETAPYFGTSGGAIMTEGSYLTVKNSKFTTTGNPTVTFAGGFIDVVGGGEFNLYDSSLTGNGAVWNTAWQYRTAKYGGAIAFENGASAKGHIKGTTMKNFMVDHTGAVIAVGHRKGDTKEYGQTTVDLKIEDSTLQNAHAYSWNAGCAGGGLYISPGSNVVMSGGVIEAMTANYGAAVYNKGNLTLENQVKIRNNTTTQMAAGVMNDGYLNVHSAAFTNNKKSTDAAFNNGNHQFKKEHAGDSIYAKKDVIIGTEATFDGNDVRVFDKTSAVLLSGPRNNVINVSISEAPNQANNNVFQEDFAETAGRYVGYLVGKGMTDADLKAAYKPEGLAGGYVPTAEDAKKLHYVSRTVEAGQIAKVDDHTGVALWDYVYDPEASTIVLGQRAKMVYHCNHEFASIEGGEYDSEAEEQTLEQVYTFYKSGDGAPKVSIDNAPAKELTKIEKEPVLQVGNEAYGFMGWYKPAWKGKPIYDEVTKTPQDGEKYNFEKGTFTGTWHTNTNDKITDILSVSDKNTLNTYAVYKRSGITVRVKKVWNAAEKEDVTFILKGGEKDVEKTLSKDSDTDYVEFKDLPLFDAEGRYMFDQYTVEEKGEADGKVKLGGKTYAVEVINDAANMSELEMEPQTKYYKVTNTQLTSVKVTKEWQGNGTTPASKVEAQLYKSVGGGEPVLVQTEALTAANQWTKEFTDLPASEAVNGQQKPVVYSVKEKGTTETGTVELEGKKYQVTVNGTQETGFTIVNKQYVDITPLTPGTTTLKVSKVWAGDVKETETKVQLLKNGQPEGEPIALNEGNGWSHTFEGLKAVDTVDQKDKNVYSIKEVGETDGVVTLNGNSYSVKITQPSKTEAVITNTHMPKKQVKVTKEWAGEKTTPASAVTVQLYQTVDGVESQVANGTKELTKASGWTAAFTDLPGVQKDGDTLKPITYTVREVGEKDGKIQLEGKTYQVSVSGDETKGFVISNKEEAGTTPLTPAKTSLKVSKIWKDGDGEAEVKVQLLKNGQPEGEPVALNKDNGWSHTFEGLKATDTVKPGDKNVYTVKEVGETDGVVTLNGNSYSVKITQPSKTESVITNTHMPKKQVKVTKEWAGEKTIPASAVTVQLYQTIDGVESPVENGTKELTKASGWTATFADLPGVQKDGDTLKPITYTVREVGEKDGKIQLEGKTYQVSVSGDETKGFVISNKQEVGTTPLTPSKTSLKVSKVWDGKEGAKEITVQLLKNGEAFGEPVTFGEKEDWSYTFKDLAVVDTVDQKEKNLYTVQEVGEKDGVIAVGDLKYQVSYEAKGAETVITNKEIKEEPPKPTENRSEKPGKPPVNEKPSGTKKVPKTGDTAGMAGYMSVLLLAAGGICITAGRKLRKR